MPWLVENRHCRLCALQDYSWPWNPQTSEAPSLPFSFLSPERPRGFVLLVLPVTPAVYNLYSLAFKTVSINRSQAADFVWSHMDVKKRGLFSSTQLLAGSASGESTRRLLSSEKSGWPLLNVRPWMNWTRKAWLLRLLSHSPRTKSVTWEGWSFSPGQMVKNQWLNSLQLLEF